MPPARAGGGAKAKGATGRRGSTLGGANGAFVRDPRWVTDVAFKPMKKISDEELEAARKMFFDIDRDGSGSIDCVELGMMLRSLGQNPTEQELKDLIDSVDDGDKDGQIQLREFLKLFTMGLDAKGMGASASEVTNIFSALGGTHTLLTGTSRTRDDTDPASTVASTDMYAKIMNDYELEVSLEDTFGKNFSKDLLSKADIDAIMHDK